MHRNPGRKPNNPNQFSLLRDFFTQKSVESHQMGCSQLWKWPCSQGRASRLPLLFAFRVPTAPTIAGSGYVTEFNRTSARSVSLTALGSARSDASLSTDALGRRPTNAWTDDRIGWGASSSSCSPRQPSSSSQTDSAHSENRLLGSEKNAVAVTVENKEG